MCAAEDEPAAILERGLDRLCGAPARSALDQQSAEGDNQRQRKTCEKQVECDAHNDFRMVMWSWFRKKLEYY